MSESRNENRQSVRIVHRCLSCISLVVNNVMIQCNKKRIIITSNSSVKGDNK
jgi:hypothetical protein